MPVTIKSAPHDANLIKVDPDSLATSAKGILEKILREQAEPCDELSDEEDDSSLRYADEKLKAMLREIRAEEKANRQKFEESMSKLELFQSSIDPNESINFQYVTNGFVSACISAYSSHHHLIIRPEDIWFAILTQFSFFFNAHAEEFRDKFVDHQGQKELRLRYNAPSRYHFDFGVFAKDMSGELDRNIKDQTLKDWIIPDFSTTTRNDTIVASVLMMSTLQKFFTYTCCIECGIPTVTLLGKKSDYESVLKHLDKLDEFGEESQRFAELLRPILRRFMASFDDPHSPEVIEFWEKIYSFRSRGSGPDYFSGWLTAFCYWNNEGKCLDFVKKYQANISPGDGYLFLDKTIYHHVDLENIPAGWCKVPVRLIDHGEEIPSWMISGSVGVNYEESPQGVGLDTVQPATGWFMFTGGFQQGEKKG